MKTTLLRFFSIAILSLSASHAENQEAKSERAVFAQYCFWTGEMRLGQIDGVRTTEAGYYQGREVTSVTYDPTRISFSKLAKLARQADLADQIYATTADQKSAAASEGLRGVAVLSEGYQKAPADDQKKQIQGTAWASLDLTAEQATKVNSFARVDSEKARTFLSPEQRQKLK